ncbi:glycosyltransferase family 4 protein [Xanthomarina spongicola]|uniref:Glycosyltransferase involved in cell wall biosynthesis n=1 Tax=Xanthomarina spongicola TaxID=570520 RepID=A0A316DKD3_9FLAO|nr:glycosyltransferase family 4 protein [Xanthomarina spongicola]PWK18008.1 glycosyltransferase involved in cell wall biosynthesis [Xanthomarina spongicola]
MIKTNSKPVHKILWLAPVFNHYKARFLNHLSNDQNVELTVLSGSGREGSGDEELEGDWGFQTVRVEVPKSKFGWSREVRQSLKSNFKNFDWVLVPAEKKNLLLFIYAIYLRQKHKGTKLFSYNHQFTKPKKGNVKRIDLLITKFIFRNLDRVIFYTEDICKKAIQSKLVAPEKAYWANNTIDTLEVEKFYDFILPPKEPITIVFIGRLIAIKRIEDLILFFADLCRKHEDKFVLEIIGDGPQNQIVKSTQKTNSNIIWHGTLVDEEKIAPIMSRASLVFVPGLAGLSINHAFAYGRPYATFSADRHGPEISYLKDGENGFIIENNIKIIEEFLNNPKKIEDFCKSAYEASKALSVNRWIEQIVVALD